MNEEYKKADSEFGYTYDTKIIAKDFSVWLRGEISALLSENKSNDAQEALIAYTRLMEVAINKGVV